MDKNHVVPVYNGHISAIKKNEIIPFSAIWMDMEVIILNEISQRNKYVIALICRVNFLKRYK